MYLALHRFNNEEHIHIMFRSYARELKVESLYFFVNGYENERDQFWHT